MQKTIIMSDNAPAPIGPYSQAVEMNGMLFLSGQIALVPGSDHLVMNSIKEETQQVMKNIEAVLTQAGLNFEHVVKTSIFLSDMEHFSAVNEVYATFFASNFPARETVHVAGLPKAVNVEISMIACR
jgi:2-iminobutanoate/2-iminopropanoate deaminase